MDRVCDPFSLFSDGVLRVDEIKLTRESSPLPPAPYNVKYSQLDVVQKYFLLPCVNLFSLQCGTIGRVPIFITRTSLSLYTVCV